MLYKKLMCLLAVFATLGVTGCASVTGTPIQSVSVQAKEKSGTEVAGASCELSNDEGKWFVTTPGTVTIHRSNKDLQISCKKDGLEEGKGAVVSDTKASMFGNIILGGVVGAIIDHNNGSAYEYPSVIEILMGSFTSITTKSAPQPATSAPQQATQATKPQENKAETVAVAASAQTTESAGSH